MPSFNFGFMLVPQIKTSPMSISMVDVLWDGPEEMSRKQVYDTRLET